MLELLYPPLWNSCPEEEALDYFQIALLCVQNEPDKRPNMPQVVHMLDSSDPLRIPSFSSSDCDNVRSCSYFESEPNGVLDDDEIMLEPR